MTALKEGKPYMNKFSLSEAEQFAIVFHFVCQIQ